MEYAALEHNSSVRGSISEFPAEIRVSANAFPVNDRLIPGHSDLAFRAEASDGNQCRSDCRSQWRRCAMSLELRKQDWTSVGPYVTLSLATGANRMLPELGFKEANPRKYERAETCSS